MNVAEEAALTAEEQAAFDRVVSWLPRAKTEPLKPHTPKSLQRYEELLAVQSALNKEAPSVIEEADAVLAEDREPPSSWAPLDLRTHMGPDDGHDGPTLLVREDGEALMYEGRRNELHGPPESGKSWVALLVVAELLARDQVAVWIDFEDTPRAIVTRLLALGVNEQTILESFRYIQPAERLTTATELDLRLAIAGASLVVVDAVNEAMTAAGLNPNDNRDIAAWYDTIPRLASLADAASLMLDHVAKDPEQRRGATGGGHKTAALDGASYSLDAKTPFGRGSTGLLALRIGKDRPGYIRGQHPGAHPTVAEITIDATDPTDLVVEVKEPAATRGSDDWRPTYLMEKVSRFLEVRGEPATQTLVTEQVKGRRAYIIEALTNLVTEGFVQQTTGDRSSILYTSIRPFSEEER